MPRSIFFPVPGKAAGALKKYISKTPEIFTMIKSTTADNGLPPHDTKNKGCPETAFYYTYYQSVTVLLI